MIPLSEAPVPLYVAIVMGSFVAPVMGTAIAVRRQRRHPWAHGAIAMNVYLGLAIPALSTRWPALSWFYVLALGGGTAALLSALVAARGLRRGKDARKRAFSTAAALTVPMVVVSGAFFAPYLLLAWIPAIALTCEAGRALNSED